MAAVCLATSVVHMLMVFLFVAPPNQISQRYGTQINAWIYPFFEQNWRLFAPDPQSNTTQIEVRTASIPSAGNSRAQRTRRTPRISGWFDLSAPDEAAVRHDFFPSHTAQNMLRRAWTSYLDTNGNADQPHSERALMMQEYLRNIAVERVRTHQHGDVEAVQLRVRTQPIPAPTPAGAPHRIAPNLVETRLLPWWVVPHGN